jgi:hypothetical protein
VRTLAMSGVVVFWAVLGGAVLAGAAPATAAQAPAAVGPAPAAVAPAPATAGPAPASRIGATDTARPGPSITATATVITVDKISCASTGVCLASGLEKVSATAPATWVAEVWNGHAWVLYAVPAPAKGATEVTLTAVSCVKGPFCVAVGAYLTADKATASFAVTWIGGKITITPALPQPAQVSAVTLNAVSCVSAKYCVAVGDVSTVPGGTAALLFETWNGTKWTAATKALSANAYVGLNDISCVTTARCVAVGYTSTITGTRTVSAFAEIWTGSAFTGLALPAPAGTIEPYLSAVACGSATACVATGYDFANLGKNKGLAFTEMLNKTTWKLGKVPWQKGVTTSFLFDVSCASAVYCIATGNTGYTGTTSAAALAYNGTSWSVSALPPPPRGDTDDLSGVSCAAASRCVAIGNISPPSGLSSSVLSAFLTGTRWTLLTVG